MARLRIARAAREDIRSIRSYSKSTFGPDVGLQYVEGLRAALKRLAGYPGMGSAETGLVEDMRSFSYRSHRIYYVADGQSILIVRILHHAQDARPTLNRNQ